MPTAPRATLPRIGLFVCLAVPVNPLDGAAQRLLVVGRGDDAVGVIDLRDGRVTRTIHAGEFPHEIAVDTIRGRAYVPAYGGHTLAAIDIVSSSIVHLFDLTPHTALHGILVSGDGSTVWATAEESRGVVEIDAMTGGIRRVWPTRAYPSHMLTGTRDGRKLYVASMDSGTVSVIDRVHGTVRVIPTGAGAEGIDIAPDGTHVWVSNRGENTLSVIDTEADTVVTTIASGGAFPVKVRFRPDGRQVWVANNQSGEVAVFDAHTRRLVEAIEVGERPLGLTFSADSRLGYVSRPGANEVLEIDTETFAIRRRFATPGSPDGMAWLPN